MTDYSSHAELLCHSHALFEGKKGFDDACNKCVNVVLMSVLLSNLSSST